MKHNKKLFIILLVAFLLVGLGTLAASDVTKNDTSLTKTAEVSKHDTLSKEITSASKVLTTKNDDNTKIVNTKSNTKTDKITTNTTNKKTTSTKTVKTAPINLDVRNYTTLHGILTNSSSEKVTINIQDDITLSGNTTLNSTIKTLFINGNKKTINGNGLYQFLNIPGNSTVFIYNLNIINCTAEYGGAIYMGSGSTITIHNSTLKYNNAIWGGGAVRGSDNSTIKITNSNLTNNNAQSGGAIHGGINSSISITNTNLNYNTGRISINSRAVGGISRGGAIYGDINSNMIITNSRLNNNTAHQGGAINGGDYSTIKITNSTLNYNTATGFYGSGGAIDNFSGTLIITNSKLTHNKADVVGGAIYGESTNITVTNSNLKNNNATHGGGALFNNCGTLTITNSNLTHNNANNSGGAIYGESTNITVTNSNLKNNTATTGGAIHNQWGNSNIRNSNLTCNAARGRDGNGGAIKHSGYLTITNSNLNYNTATKGDGGAICNNYGYLNITASNLTHNTVQWDGGAIYGNISSIITVTNSNLNYNTAGDGGAIYGLGTYSITVTNSNLKNNIARRIYDDSYPIPNGGGSCGGAIYGYSCTKITVQNSNITNNTAHWGGGAIYAISNGIVTVTNSNLRNNSAYIGGAITSENRTIVTNSNLTHNYGGAISGDILIINNTQITNNIGGLRDEIINAGSFFGESSITLQNSNLSDNYLNYGCVVDFSMADNILITNNIFKNNTNCSYYKFFSDVKDPAKVKIQNNTYDNKYGPIIKLTPVRGIIGEKITLTANITDENGKPVNGGNLAFKLNDKTLRSDGRFDSTAPAMKFKVKNGKVTYTINADLYLRNAKKLAASYSGNSKYIETSSPVVSAQIQKRFAKITLTTTPTRAKQYDTIQFTATIQDTTKNAKNTTFINKNTKVMFKVNGKTLKDNKGKTIYVPVNANKQAIYNYVVPAGTGGITANKQARDYKVEAILVGDNYYPGAKNTSKFNIERSTTYVNITQARVTNNNVLSVKATLKDYKGNNLIGTNKVSIKINGKNYIDSKNGKAKYWSVKNGVVDLSSIQADLKTTIKRVMLVTGERQAYHEGRAEITNIVRA